jgi:hypothetical protein
MAIEATWNRSPAASLPAADPLEQLRIAEHADWTLLGMVSCVALATLALATASALLV